ncbi:MAG: ABC transporter permease, partial [Lachnospiraceae bacterium]|nr:ABC transporter permease [Lachnospiraceae bacterium]
MKNKIALTTLREIKSTLGRFIAIMAIIALGVGFYAGLMVTDPAMRESMNIYLKGNQFFDYRMISTLGFEDEDIEKIAAAEGVRAAEGSKTQDMLVMVEDRERTVKVMSITKDVNKAVLIEGRLPEADNECVIDSMIYGDWAIGKTLNFTEENSGDDLENFKHSALEIVGIVKSPLYIQYERGTTSLGNGSLDGFIFVDKSAFDTDYYTECYVKLDKDPDLYSDEYKELLEANDAVFEELLDNTALERYDRIVADANEELADAKEEFETEKADAE